MERRGGKVFDPEMNYLMQEQIFSWQQWVIDPWKLRIAAGENKKKVNKFRFELESSGSI